MSDLLKKLLDRFIKQNLLANKKGRHLLNIDVKNADSCLSSDKINYGAEAASCLKKAHLADGVAKTFYLDAKSFYQSVTSYLQDDLPLKNSLLNNLQY